MTGGVVIRLARLDDEPAISAIRLAVRENVLSDPSKVTHADYVAYMGTVGCGWVAEADGRVVGFAMANRSGLIWALFMDGAYEGRGIARALLDRATDWLAAEGVARAFLDTGAGTRAEGFYRRLGWREIARSGTRVDFSFELVKRG